MDEFVTKSFKELYMLCHLLALLLSVRPPTVRCSGWSVSLWWLWVLLAPPSPSWTAVFSCSGWLAWTCPTPSCSPSWSVSSSSRRRTAMEPRWVCWRGSSWGCWAGSHSLAFSPPSSSLGADWTQRGRWPSSFPFALPSCSSRWRPLCFSPGSRQPFLRMVCCPRGGMCSISSVVAFSQSSRQLLLRQPGPRGGSKLVVSRMRLLPDSFWAPPAARGAGNNRGKMAIWGENICSSVKSTCRCRSATHKRCSIQINSCCGCPAFHSVHFCPQNKSKLSEVPNEGREAGIATVFRLFKQLPLRGHNSWVERSLRLLLESMRLLRYSGTPTV